MSLQHLLVHFGVHLGVWFHKVEVAKFTITKGSPYHQLGRMLHSPHDEVWVILGDGGRLTDSSAHLGALPQLNVGLI